MAARILVIEDDPASLLLVQYLLETSGFHVLTADNGADGLSIALREAPDLVVCDLQLPALDGYEVLKELRANSRWCGAPVIAVTAFSMSGDRERVLSAGFDDYFPKPIVPETFVASISVYLDDARPRRGRT
ncbi:MAG: response regulator [Betaproteobacteria bacterium]|nr:response regulator [Betaproteobacteria bacterium]